MNIVVDQRPSILRFHSHFQIWSTMVAGFTKTLRPYNPEPLFRQDGLASYNRRQLQIPSEPTPNPLLLPIIPPSNLRPPSIAISNGSRVVQQHAHKPPLHFSERDSISYKQLPASKQSSHRHHPWPITLASSMFLSWSLDRSEAIESIVKSCHVNNVVGA